MPSMNSGVRDHIYSQIHKHIVMAVWGECRKARFCVIANRQPLPEDRGAHKSLTGENDRRHSPGQMLR